MLQYNKQIMVANCCSCCNQNHQGSSTVEIVTTNFILAPLLSSMDLESDLGKTLAVLTIEAGSMVASHGNDSFFWTVEKMSGIDVKTGYKLMTSETIYMRIFP